MPNPEGTEYLPAFASQWMAQWRVAATRLESLRRQQMRELTEADAARLFAMLDPPRPYQLRPSSGLVEQQRWFALLRKKMTSPTAELADREPSEEDTLLK